MKHQPSSEDLRFQQQFEAGIFPPSAFNHRAHVRLAYIYLCDQAPDEAFALMRDAIHQYLAHHGIAPGKYHATLTRAWILAVRHFMEGTRGTTSAEQFMQHAPLLLQQEIMLTHYTKSVLDSEQARNFFVEPDLAPIPRYI